MKNKGFTLTELLVVVAIIAVLVIVSIPVFASQVEKSSETTDIDNIKTAKDLAVAQYTYGKDLDDNLITKTGFTCYFDASSGTLTKDVPSGYGKGTETDAGCEDTYMVIKPTESIPQITYTSKTNVENKYITVFINSDGTIKTSWAGGDDKGTQIDNSTVSSVVDDENIEVTEEETESGYQASEGALPYTMTYSNRNMVGYTSSSYNSDAEFEYEGQKYYFSGFDSNALKGYAGQIVIPDSVSYIADDAFTNIGYCSGFTVKNNGRFTTLSSGKVLADSKVTKIYRATYKLGNFTIPSTVKTICDGAFKNCNLYLKSLTIPDSVTSIGTEAFYGCNYLVTINIPGSVKTIKRLTIYNSANIVKVTLGEGVETIESSGIYAKKITISVPSTLKTIYDDSLKLQKATNTFSGTYNGNTYSAISDLVAAIKQ